MTPLFPPRRFSPAGAAVGVLAGGLLLFFGVGTRMQGPPRPTPADQAVARSSAEEARRVQEEKQSGVHPVVRLLDSRFNPDAPDFLWNNERETLLRQIAASPEATRPGASAAMWAALRDGRMEAGAVLWQLEADPKILDFLAQSFEDPQYSHLRDPAAFVLGWIREERVLDVLWKQLRVAQEEEDPYGQVSLARAIGRIRRDVRARQILEKIGRLPAPEGRQGELDRSPGALAEAALKDLE